MTTSLPRGNITLPGAVFAIGGRTHHAGQAGGANPMRDIPRFVEMLDKKRSDAKRWPRLLYQFRGCGTHTNKLHTAPRSLRS